MPAGRRQRLAGTQAKAEQKRVGVAGSTGQTAGRRRRFRVVPLLPAAQVEGTGVRELEILHDRGIDRSRRERSRGCPLPVDPCPAQGGLDPGRASPPPPRGMMRENFAAPLEPAPSGRRRPARPRAGERRGRKLAAVDRDEVRRSLADEDVLDVLRPAAAGRDEEGVRKSPAGGEDQAPGRVHRAARKRVLRRETGVGLALRRRAKVVAFRLELPAMRERVRPRRDRLRLQRFDLVVAFRAHFRRYDSVQVLVEVHAIDQVQRAPRVRRDEEAPPIGLLVDRDVGGNAGSGRRGVDLDGRSEATPGAVLGGDADDRGARRRVPAGRSLEHDCFPSGVSDFRCERFRFTPCVEASEENAIDPALRRERDRSGDLKIRRELLQGAPRRLFLREGGGLDGVTRCPGWGALGTKQDGTAKELRVPGGNDDPRLSRSSVRQLGQVALQPDAIQDSARGRRGRNRNRGRCAAARPALGGGCRRRLLLRRLRGRSGRAADHPRDRE